MPDTQPLTDEAVAEIEAVNKAYRIDWRYPNHRERVAALCVSYERRMKG